MIAVGRSTGEKGAGSIGADMVYTSGRTCPQLIAPLKNASSATPVVASAAALLIALGRRDPTLSADPTNQQGANRFGHTISNAERSEVIKAALLAGADRVTHNSVIIDGGIPNISNYRLKPQDRTASGLDRRYGAGQLNIYNSYHIISAGEQNSKEDALASAGIIGNYGFDYDPIFGGLNGSNTIASYQFSVNDGINYLWAALVWNIKIKGGTGSLFNSEATLYNLDLFLYDITDPNTSHLVVSSTGSGENTENMWVRLGKQRNYLIQIKPGAGQTAFIWDYALAWRIGNPPEGSDPR